MAKKYRQRPALRAASIYRLVLDGRLSIYPVKRTPVMYLTAGKHVYQTWLRRKRDGTIVRKSAVTYLRKGIFLIPRWFPVPDWEVEYLTRQGIPWPIMGIARIEEVLQRLCLMQVEDLDHAGRQQVHILDEYTKLDYRSMPSFTILFQSILRAETINRKIELRKMGVDNLYTFVTLRLKEFARSIRSIAQNAPLFKQEVTEKERQTIIHHLRRIARDCREMTMRPVGRRLVFAARSLELAAEHIEKGRLALAVARLSAALKNLEYPQSQNNEQ